MPYARPTLSQLITQTAAYIQAALPGADALLRRSVLTVLGRVLSGQHHQQYGFLDWIAKNAVPFTATGEFLEGWGALKGLSRKAATFAAFTASSSGNTPSATLLGPVTLLRSDGTSYSSGGGTCDGSGNLTLNIGATIAGSAGNVSVGSALTLQSPAAGFSPNFTVQSISLTASDIETDSAFGTRVLLAYQNPPQGGDLADYVNWALAVPGVTRAWAGDSTIMGPGTATVYFMMDDVNHTNGIPNGTNGVSQYDSRDVAAVGDQLAVANYIFTKRPVTSLVYAAAPVSVPFNITLSEVPTSTTIRNAISAALAGFILREASPGGVLLLSTLTPGGTLLLSHLEAALNAVAGLDHFVLVSPTADVTVTTGRISTPGSITYL